MSCVYKLWIEIYCIFSAVLLCNAGNVDDIIGPSNVIGFAGQRIIFMWNTTNQIPIRSAIFGLSNNGMADPQFINVNMLTGILTFNTKISKHYAGRVDFVGNLRVGRAWFVIMNLELNDTNEYLARLTVDVDTVMSHTVTLKVKETSHLKTDRYLTSTASTISTNYSRDINVTNVEESKRTTSRPSEFMDTIILYCIISVAVAILVAVLAVVIKIKLRKRSIRHKLKREKEENCIKNKEITERTDGDTQEKLITKSA